MTNIDPNTGQTSFPWISSYPKHLDWDMAFQAHRVDQILDNAVSRYGALNCIDFMGKTTTYSQIGKMASQATKGLQALGVKKGSRVALLFPNCPSHIVFYFAILKAGGTVVNCNPLYSADELDFQISDAQADLIISIDLKVMTDKIDILLEKGTLDKAVICSFSAQLPFMKSNLFRLFKRSAIAKLEGSGQADKYIMASSVMKNDGNYTLVEIDPDKDLAVLQYTGGTTGTPKGAMLTHANLTINVQQIQAWMTGLEPGTERVLGILPFFHVFGMTVVMLTGLSIGSELLLVPKFDVADTLKLISAKKPTILPGVPTLFNALLNHPKSGSYDLSSINICISGGAPLPVEVKTEFEAKASCTMIEAYGLSETSPLATVNPLEGLPRDLSIGLPAPATEISIRSIDDPTAEMPFGESGEICIRGPQVMPGYWNNPEETHDTFTDGFFRTGDVGYIDKEDGFIYIVDRLKDMINASGYKIYPRQVEDAIYAFPAVEEVTVIGITDDYRGEAPKAFIKLKTGMTASSQDILDFLKTKLSKIEMPKEIEFRDQLPKTIIGKLSRKELKAEEQNRQG